MGAPAIPPSAPFTLKQAAPLVHPGYVVSRWYWTVRGTVAAGSITGTSNTVFEPFIVPYPITVSDLGASVATLSVGGNIQLAIYGSDPVTHLPAGAPLAVTGNISTTLAGSVSADIIGADVALPAGLYWGAVQADNATVALMAPALALIDYMNLVGTPTLASLGGGTSARGSRTVASTFGTWPNVTNSPTSEQLAYSHMLAIKVSALG